MSRSRLDFTRVDKVRKAIMREVSDVLRKEIHDPRLQNGIVSVTDVDVSGDLQHAKVFVSVFGDDEVKQAAMAALEENTSKVRYQIGQRVRLRLTPTIVFLADDSLERGAKVTELLNKIRDGQA